MTFVLSSSQPAAVMKKAKQTTYFDDHLYGEYHSENIVGYRQKLSFLAKTANMKALHKSPLIAYRDVFEDYAATFSSLTKVLKHGYLTDQKCHTLKTSLKLFVTAMSRFLMEDYPKCMVQFMAKYSVSE